MRIPHACIFLYGEKSHDNWTFMKSILPYSTFPLCPENTNNNTHYSYEGKQTYTTYTFLQYTTEFSPNYSI